MNACISLESTASSHDELGDLMDQTIQVVTSNEHEDSHVVFNIINILTEDSNMNELRLTTLENLARSWGGTVTPMIEGRAVEVAEAADQESHAKQYAIGRYNSQDQWFAVKLLGVRKKAPRFRVRFVSRVDDETTHACCLPSPHIDYVDCVTSTKPDGRVGKPLHFRNTTNA